MREGSGKMKIEKKWKNCRVLLLFLVGHRRDVCASGRLTYDGLSLEGITAKKHFLSGNCLDVDKSMNFITGKYFYKRCQRS